MSDKTGESRVTPLPKLGYSCVFVPVPLCPESIVVFPAEDTQLVAAPGHGALLSLGSGRGPGSPPGLWWGRP